MNPVPLSYFQISTLMCCVGKIFVSELHSISYFHRAIESICTYYLEKVSKIPDLDHTFEPEWFT